MLRRTSTTARPEWDIVASIILQVLLAMSVGLTLLVGSMLGLSTIPCIEVGRYCNFALIGLGTGIALWVPIAAVVVFTVWTIRRLVTGRMAWWVPVVGLLICAAGYGAGSVFVTIGMPMPLMGG
ncbi:hypothetical protein SAMN04489806_1750 [Paramicrobacterium humi]|uniref:Uncharacterized protein n=1 Tax=Paramicrobacterium humi TaxID=640635 RepID=A0A1H4M413_9MICO|nr:hypothetical protein [Microbacterium humi]SEB77746.1 hypothetical protein SAMN04489806_1750 [Microbacterium humi]